MAGTGPAGLTLMVEVKRSMLITVRKAGIRAAIIAMTALCTVPVIAQEQGPPPGARAERMGGRQLEMLTQRLNLTPDQQAKVKTIDEDSSKQASAVRNDTSLSDTDRRSKMMDI